MKTYKLQAWAVKKMNVSSLCPTKSEPNVAMLLAASNIHGVVLKHIKAKSFKGIDFERFFGELSELRNGNPITVLLNNCSIHKTKAVQKLAS